MINMYNPFTPYDLEAPRPELQGIDDLQPEEQEDLRVKAALIGCGTTMLGIVLALLLCALLGSCKQVEYVAVPQHHTDTLRVAQTQRDSIYVHDSVSVTHWGDTVHVDRWHTHYRDRWHHDTIYRSRVDSVPVPVIKRVAAPLTWWQQTRQTVGTIVIICLFVWLFWKIYVILHQKL